MSVTLALAIFVVIWWTVLFAVLPFGVRTQAEDDAVVPGTPASAPTHPRLARVVWLTTGVSCVLFALFLLVVSYHTAALQWIEGAAR
jgi:predicted secreted protein